jgi:hypothetical protein
VPTFFGGRLVEQSVSRNVLKLVRGDQSGHGLKGNLESRQTDIDSTESELVRAWAGASSAVAVFIGGNNAANSNSSVIHSSSIHHHCCCAQMKMDKA